MTTAAISKKEDSAFAIATLVLASRARDLSEFNAWCSRREQQELFAGRIPSSLDARNTPLNPFAVESFAQVLFRRLGIRTAPTQTVTFAEARQLPEGKFVVKFAEVKESGIALRAAFPFSTPPVASPAYCLASEVVEDAATFDYIRRKFGVTPGLDRPYAALANVAARSSEKLCAGLTSIVLRKECRAADALYARFLPNVGELGKIRAAMRWDREAFLKICAARSFVACSAPHDSNVLVTRSGELVSIDHCSASREDGDDLRMLFRFIRRDSQAFGVLGDVAALTTDDIRASISKIPRHPACGSTDGLSDYFVARLRLWRSLYEAAPSRALAQAAV